ncbi:MAG: hypothetical protein RL134_2259, partial [Actinomycetota bacterium]
AIDGVQLAYAVTDGYRRSELSVGSTRDNRSQTLTADDAYLQDRRVHDYFPADPEARQSLAVYEGGLVTASSSGSEVTALRGRSSAAQPWAALDGDPVTAWVSGDLESGVGQWWQVTTEDPFTAPWVTVRLVVGQIAGIEPAAVTVTTDAGEITVAVEATDQAQRLPLPDGPTRTLRLTLESVVDGGPGEAFGLREVDIPGVDVTRLVAAAGVADGGPIVLTARKGEQTGCAAVAGQLICSPQLGRVGEERTGIQRIVEVGAPGEYRVRMWVRPRAGSSLDRLLTPTLPVSPRAEATSVFTSDPAGRPQAAVDGVLSTAWLASPLDDRPELTVSWGEPRRVRGVRLDIAPDLVASRPLRVTVTVNGRETTDIVSARGTITVPAQEASALTIRFDNADVVRSLDPGTGSITALPIGVNEVRILGAEDIVKGPRLVDDVGVPCGFGPELAVDGDARVETAVTATVSQTLTDSLLPVTACGGRIVDLEAGRHVIEAQSTAQYAVEAIVLEPVDFSVTDAEGSPEVLEWESTQRVVEVPASDVPRILETTENANAGWRANVGGIELQPIRVDGWRQGWVVPAGVSGTVVLDFAPQSAYLGGLALGGLAVLVLVVMALVGRGRAGTPAPGLRRGRGHLMAASAVVVGLLVGGWPGVAAAGMGVLVAWLLPRPYVAGILALGAAVGAALAPWPGRLDAPDAMLIATGLLAIAALGALASPAAMRRTSGGAPMQEPASRE